MGRNPHPDRPAALQDWAAAFGTPPPAFLSVGFMQKACAYEAQCRRHGGLPATTRRALKQIATGEKAEVAKAPSLSPGAHFVREWNGRTYQVHVVTGGFEMDGKTWRSLSAIAKHITGATWSGPRFFGLNGRAGGRA
ncbi:MAG: DUF2924 domain-containing protein [Paracoccaceae bacterium]|nr:DUF2924 domain-containing protein [Paracoccaceae bacterium]MDG2260595.1 DUF2924 domain-containing protein [Paracoccaceae bacterium]